VRPIRPSFTDADYATWRQWLIYDHRPFSDRTVASLGLMSARDAL
jgi:hypothetical protein